MSKESNMTKCKVCGLLKRRILDGKFDDKNKRWVNEGNRLWNGKVCPDCHVGRMRERARLAREDG